MANSHPIPPFPLDVDRTAFGHYLSGLVDGEGTFCLEYKQHGPGRLPSPVAHFALRLRSDDGPILRLIHSFFGVGLYYRSAPRKEGWGAQAHYLVTAWKDLAMVLVPHFDAFPMRAKKRFDFLLWREMVLLGHVVSQRKRRRRPAGNGTEPLWTPAERERYQFTKELLRQQRRFQADA